MASRNGCGALKAGERRHRVEKSEGDTLPQGRRSSQEGVARQAEALQPGRDTKDGSGDRRDITEGKREWCWHNDEHECLVGVGDPRGGS